MRRILPHGRPPEKGFACLLARPCLGVVSVENGRPPVEALPARPPAWPSFALKSLRDGDALVMRTTFGIHSIPTINGNLFFYHFMMLDLGIFDFTLSSYPIKVNMVSNIAMEDSNVLGSRPMCLTIEDTSKSSLIVQVARDATTGPTFQNECGGVETPAKDFKPRKPRKRPKEMSQLNFLGVRKFKRQAKTLKLALVGSQPDVGNFLYLYLLFLLFHLFSFIFLSSLQRKILLV